MNIRIALLALAGTAMLSTAALAATNSKDENHPASHPQMADACMALESQYDNALDSKPNAAKLDQAEALGSTGTTECNDGQGNVGIHQLEHALLELGVKPVA